MLLTRCTKLKGELIRNLPSTMKDELINFEGVIPDGIMASLYVNDSFYKKERHNFLNRRTDLLEKMYCARGKREELSQHDDWINVETDEEVKFIRDYPQFKQLIESIIFMDENRNIVKVVPIDEYLEHHKI